MTQNTPTSRSVHAFVLEDKTPTLQKQELLLDPPKSEEVLVDVVACGVCHTDLHVLKDEVSFPRPAVLGHEISGIIREVGDDVKHVAAGDRVVCSFIMPCGNCRHCNNGLAEICENFFLKNRLQGRLLDDTTRLHRENGEDVAMYSMSGHATQSVVPASAVFALPGSVSLQDAAILGCSIFTGYGSVHEVAQVQPGEAVAVVAAGGIGLSIIHLAKAAGASEVIAVDVDDEKLELARKLGATTTVNSTVNDPIQYITEQLGHGVDVAFEALGSTPTTRLAVDLVDDGGRVVLAGIAPAGHTLDVEITKVVRRKIRILGSFGAHPQHTMSKVVKLAEDGLIDLKQLITDRFPFDQLDHAYSELANRRIRGRGIITVRDDQ